MDPQVSGFWARLKANRPAYTLTILVTLAVGIAARAAAAIRSVKAPGVKISSARAGATAFPAKHPMNATAAISNAIAGMIFRMAIPL